MDIGTFSQEFFTQLKQTSLLEGIGVLCGMTQVLLASRNHVALYPFGIVSTVVFIYLFARPETGLYAEALLNVYYLVMSIYGWIKWKKNNESENSVAIGINNTKDWTITAGIVAGGWIVLYVTLSRYTDSNVPATDAFVSATAWAGMWLLARHKVENWILLNISNAIAIPLLIYKGMAFAAVFTLFLFIVAIFGYLRWRKQYRLAHAS